MGWGLNRSLQISCDFPTEGFAPRTIDNLHGFKFDEICCGGNYSMGLIRDPGLTEL